MAGRAHGPGSFDVFLSYNRRDKDVVDRIAVGMQRAGVRPWFDIWSLTPGGTWQDEMAAGLADSRSCAVLLGPHDVGGWGRIEMAVALDRTTREPGFRVFPVLLPGLEPFDPNSLPLLLRTRTWVDLRTGPDDARAMQQLLRAVKGLPFGPRAAVEPRPGTCPYRGLQTFHEEHAEFFFGREGAVQRLLEQLRASRFLAVLGPSGSGKSSLVRAGVVPALRTGGLPGSERWRIGVIRPGAQPLAALAAQLLALEGGNGMQGTVDGLARDSRTLHLAVELTLAQDAPDARVLLVIDQFEELFTLCDSEADRAATLDNLVHATTIPGGRTVAVLAMRADWYPALAAYPHAAQLAQNHQALVGPLDEVGLRRVIVEPARRAGLELEAGLAETILDDVAGEPGRLPLLEHALLETWERRLGTTLTLEGYRDSGGVRDALSARAEQVFGELAPAEQEIARHVLLRLTQPGEGTEDTRRRAELSELVTSEGNRAAVEEVANRLAAARLLSVDSGPDGTTWLDVSHEMLIRAWPRLREWIDEQRDDLRFHRRLTAAAQEWERQGRDRSLLLRGRPLGAALDWARATDRGLNRLERSFLAAAARSARSRTRRLRVLAAALTCLLILAVGSAAVAIRQSQRANEERATAELAARAADSRRLAAEAVGGLRSSIDLPSLLALEAYLRAPTVEARSALVKVLQAAPRLRATARFHDSAQVPLVDVTSGGTVVSAGWDRKVRFWDAALARPLRDPIALAAEPQGLAVSSDGRWLAVATDGRIRVWEIDTGRSATPRADRFAGHVLAIAVGGSGPLLAAVRDDGSARLYRLPGLEPVGRWLPGSGNAATAVAFAANDTIAVGGQGDGWIRRWDVSGRRLEPVDSGDRTVSGLAVTPDGNRLAGVGPEGVALWRRSTGRVLRHASGDTAYTGVAVNRNGSRVVTASDDGSLQLFNADGLQPAGPAMRGHEGAVAGLAFGAGGATVISGGDDGTLRLWDVSRAAAPATAQADGVAGMDGVALSPDGRSLVARGADGSLWFSDAPGERTADGPRPAAGGAITALTYSADGQRIAVADRDGAVRVWDAQARVPVGKPLQVGVRDPIISLDRGGRLLASGGIQNTGVTLWDVEGGREIGRLPGSDRPVGALTFSPDGDVVASGGYDGVVRLWDVAARRARATLGPGGGGVVRHLAFAGNGGTLAADSSASGVALWDVARRHRLGATLDVGGPVEAMAFSRDGRTLALASGRSVRLWDVPRLSRLGDALRGHDEGIAAVAFAPDGALVSADRAGAVVRWDPLLASERPDAWRRRVCRMVGRDLTETQWREALPGTPYRPACAQPQALTP